ncbi:TetR/AcrR family transcriptional regulator [Isoalcanivorax indicus]|uniref:TetR/AcrR family transcriptional regulator n=1 Tax=Isoalcanivorax indicus TaxID=2202653 RepID=UPI000DB9D91D|nr:TetR/AcrR family transcriptional regulator [Isoalcanivorax indicus]
MGRPGKFTTDIVLDAALDVLERDGMRALTMTRVCEQLNAPSGSLYHRFPSRDALLVALWLRCAERFQSGMEAVLLEHDDTRAAAHAAVRYFIARTRQHRAEALVLMAWRREDLLGSHWPPKVRKRAEALAADHHRVAKDFARRLWPHGQGDLARLNYALSGLPMAAVLDELRGSRPMHNAEDWVITALDAVLQDCW